MSDPTNDIDGLLGYLSICANRYSCHTLPSDVAANYRASLTALVAERDGLRAELAAAIKQRDDARRLYRALLDGIKDAASPREKEGGGA